MLKKTTDKYMCKHQHFLMYYFNTKYNILISNNIPITCGHIQKCKKKKTSSKWPLFGNLVFVWRYIFCVHQPTTTKYKFM